VTFGPWSPALIDAVERGKQLRSLQALAAVFCGSASPLVVALRQAECNASALPRAAELLDRMPSLTRRKMLATFGAVTWPREHR
jgi:hypothetical protein